jgi:hypothetical protein
MTRITAIALYVAATLVTAGSALAQDHGVQSTVPFSFSVNNSSLPAGNYTISSDPASANTLSIRNRQDKVNIWVMGLVDSNEPGRSGSLVFHQYGDQYFLSEIRYANSSKKIHFPSSKMEKRAREHVQQASLPANADVLVALN